LWDFLKKINRQGTTILLTTHYIEEAERLCSRIGVIHQGKVVALDATDNLRRKIQVDQVEFALKHPMKEIPEALKLCVKEVFEGGKKIRFEDQPNVIAQVLRVFHEQQIEIEKIDVNRPTLEDVFLKLTSKEQMEFYV